MTVHSIDPAYHIAIDPAIYSTYIVIDPAIYPSYHIAIYLPDYIVIDRAYRIAMDLAIYPVYHIARALAIYLV
jgi:hypothetical protein